MDLIVNDCSFSTLFTLCFCNCLLHSTISVRSVSPYTTLHYSTAHCSVEGTISIIACVVAWLPRQATYGWSAVPDRWNDWNLITASSCTPVLLADGSRHRAVPHTPARMPCQVVLILNIHVLYAGLSTSLSPPPCFATRIVVVGWTTDPSRMPMRQEP